MLLPATGFIPSDLTFRNVAPSREVVARWGEKCGPGYEFRDSDGEEYHLYVEELYARVHQCPMEYRILPLHFARGLLEESKGSDVNWAAFAMIRCFSHLKRAPFQPHPEFEDVTAPLPWKHPKVMPLAGDSQGGSESDDVQEVRTRTVYVETLVYGSSEPCSVGPVYSQLCPLSQLCIDWSKPSF